MSDFIKTIEIQTDLEKERIRLLNRVVNLEQDIGILREEADKMFKRHEDSWCKVWSHFFPDAPKPRSPEEVAQKILDEIERYSK